MKQYHLDVVGRTGPEYPIRDIFGTGTTPVQVEVTGTVSYRIVGKCHKNAPWRELRASASAGFLESVTYVPFMAIEIVSKTGNGAVDFWIGDQ